MTREGRENRDMATTRFCLQTDSAPDDVVHWCHVAQVGDEAIIAMPTKAYTVWLIRRANNRIWWRLQGEHGATVPLDDAVYRLQLLQSSAEA